MCQYLWLFAPNVQCTLWQTLKWKPTGNNAINILKLLQFAYISWHYQMDHSGMNKSIIILDSYIWHGTTAVNTQKSNYLTYWMCSSILLLHWNQTSLPVTLWWKKAQFLQIPNLMNTSVQKCHSMIPYKIRPIFPLTFTTAIFATI